MNKKRNILVIILLVICFIVLSILLFIVFNSSKITEEQIVNNLTLMGEEIYTEYYYPEITKGKSTDEIKEYLSQFKEIGLKFNLTELDKYNDEFKSNISKFKSDNKACDKDNTMVIIYPTEPYSQIDFKADVKLDCGF